MGAPCGSLAPAQPLAQGFPPLGVCCFPLRSPSFLFRGSSLPGMGAHTLLVQWAPGTPWPVSCRARCMGETLETPPSHSDNLPYSSPTSPGCPSSEARQALLPACPGMGWEGVPESCPHSPRPTWLQRRQATSWDKLHALHPLCPGAAKSERAVLV